MAAPAGEPKSDASVDVSSEAARKTVRESRGWKVALAISSLCFVAAAVAGVVSIRETFTSALVATEKQSPAYQSALGAIASTVASVLTSLVGIIVVLVGRSNQESAQQAAIVLQEARLKAERELAKANVEAAEELERTKARLAETAARELAETNERAAAKLERTKMALAANADRARSIIAAHRLMTERGQAYYIELERLAIDQWRPSEAEQAELAVQQAIANATLIDRADLAVFVNFLQVGLRITDNMRKYSNIPRKEFWADEGKTLGLALRAWHLRSTESVERLYSRIGAEVPDQEAEAPALAGDGVET